MPSTNALLKNEVTIFYLLTFAPLILIAYFNVFGVLIPMFGFLLLYLKKEDLPFDQKKEFVRVVFGVTLMIGSFFLYFSWVPLFFSHVYFYNVTNYIVYIFGLCFGFFGLSWLKRAFSPLFLMVAAPASHFIPIVLEPHASPYAIPAATDITLSILRVLGIPVIRSSTNVLILQQVMDNCLFR